MLNQRSILAGIFALLIIVSPMTAAQAQPPMVPAMAAELTQYPGSKVEMSTEAPGGNMITNLNCGKATPEEVSAYYKAKLTEKGYTVNAIPGSPNLVGINGEKHVMIDFDTENGNTVVSLAMGGGSEGMSGQTPGMPSMPGTMPQMPMSPQAAPGAPTMPTMPMGPGAGAPAMPTMPMAPGAPAMPGPAATPGAGQAQYPEELKAIVAQYPNSMMMASHNNEDETAAVMTVGDPAEKVLEYYKSAIGKGGWNQTNEMTMQGNSIVEFEKGDQMLLVTVQNAGGMLMATVALAKK